MGQTNGRFFLGVTATWWCFIKHDLNVFVVM